MWWCMSVSPEAMVPVAGLLVPHNVDLKHNSAPETLSGRCALCSACRLSPSTTPHRSSFALQIALVERGTPAPYGGLLVYARASVQGATEVGGPQPSPRQHLEVVVASVQGEEIGAVTLRKEFVPFFCACAVWCVCMWCVWCINVDMWHDSGAGACLSVQAWHLLPTMRWS
jgi:hypothetical protein